MDKHSETKSIKKDILHRISFLNRNANGVSTQTVTSPTIAVGTETNLAIFAALETHAQTSAVALSSIVAMARHSVIIGTIFFTT